MSYNNSLNRFSSAIVFLNWLRYPFLGLIKLTYPLWKWLLSFRDVGYYWVRRSSKSTPNQELVFKKLSEILEDSVEIRIAVGEMGHRLMEHPAMLSGLRSAFHNNQALIEIVHGPRVDPETTTVFFMEQAGIVDLYRMPTYSRHHFILARNSSGQETLIDEGIHNEQIWVNNSDETLASLARFYYVTTRAKRVIASRKIEFEARKQVSSRINNHPQLNPTQNYSFFGYVLDAILNIPLEHLSQPFSLFFDIPLPFHSRAWYKEGKFMSKELLEKANRVATMPVAEDVRVWLDSRLEELAQNPPPPGSESLQDLLVEFEERTGVSLPRHSYELFRDLHYIENPDTSIGGLDIDDELFATLVERNVWTISALRERLQDNAFLSSVGTKNGREKDWHIQLQCALT